MFGIGMPELIVIAIIALLVVGPKRLPDLAKSLGKGLSEFRRATEDATDTIKESLQMDELKRDAEDIKKSFLDRNREEDDSDQGTAAVEEKKEIPPPNAAS